MTAALSSPTMRCVLALLLIAACADPVDEGGAADIQGEQKADGSIGIEVTARIKPGHFDVLLSTKVPRRGYVFYAAEGTKVSLETLVKGTTSNLDTLIKLYGPRLADGTYPKTIAS